MLKVKELKQISVDDWDNLVMETYGKQYSFQQQDGCKDRGVEYITVPCKPEDYENDTIPEVVNCEEEGVSFKAWLERDPEQPLLDRNDSFGLGLWWDRNFYPHVSMIINDLYSKGLIEAGEYEIKIDW